MKNNVLLVQGCFVFAATALLIYLLVISRGAAVITPNQGAELGSNTAAYSTQNLAAAPPDNNTSKPNANSQSSDLDSSKGTVEPGEHSGNSAAMDLSTADGTIDQFSTKNGIVTNIWMDPSKFDLFRRNGIKYLFVDVGSTADDGRITTPREEIGDFLESAKSYEDDSGYKFVLLPYSEIDTNNYNFDSSFSNNMLRDYIYLDQIGFDGAFVDIESVQSGQKGLYLQLLDSLNNELPDSSVVAAYSGSLSESGSEWEWNLAFFREVSQRSDIIVLQGYDLGLQSAEEYKSYISQQVSSIASLNWNSAFMLGVPTHNPAPETIENALKAYNSAIAGGTGPFIGVSIFSEWTISGTDWATFENLERVEK